MHVRTEWSITGTVTVLYVMFVRTDGSITGTGTGTVFYVLYVLFVGLYREYDVY